MCVRQFDHWLVHSLWTLTGMKTKHHVKAIIGSWAGAPGDGVENSKNNRQLYYRQWGRLQHPFHGKTATIFCAGHNLPALGDMLDARLGCSNRKQGSYTVSTRQPSLFQTSLRNAAYPEGTELNKTVQVM